MSQEVDYSKIEVHPKNAIKLFKVMMRIEFAMKENGHAQAIGNRIEITWDRYANEELGNEFFEAIRESGQAATLINAPPKRQTYIDGYLDWEEVGNVQSVQNLIGAVRRVRNNLFHGGKGGDPDHERNEDLVEQSLYVIDQLLRKDFDIYLRFAGLY